MLFFQLNEQLLTPIRDIGVVLDGLHLASTWPECCPSTGLPPTCAWLRHNLRLCLRSPRACARGLAWPPTSMGCPAQPIDLHPPIHFILPAQTWPGFIQFLGLPAAASPTLHSMCPDMATSLSVARLWLYLPLPNPGLPWHLRYASVLALVIPVRWHPAPHSVPSWLPGHRTSICRALPFTRQSFGSFICSPRSQPSINAFDIYP